MQGNSSEKFVQRFHNAVAELAILSQASERDQVTPESVRSSLPKGNLTIEKDVLTRCFERLVQDGHLKKDGTGYTITDDGREDVQKLQGVVMELPQLVHGNASGGSSRRAAPQTPGASTQAAGGSQGGARPSSSTTQGSSGARDPNGNR